MKSKLKKHLPIIILILFNILFAVFWGSDFGDSWDEQRRYEVAVQAISKFKKIKPSNRISGKGPIYYVAAKIGGDIIQSINPNLTHIQAWHYAHFLAFLVGVLSFYLISLKFLPSKIAFLITALFNTQPLLFGHAFINPKDIPFMSSFLITMATGIIMVDKYGKNKKSKEPIKNTTQYKIAFSKDWKELDSDQIIFGIAYIGVVSISLFIFIIQTDTVQLKIQNTINQINQPVIYNLFENFANIIFSGTIKGGITLQNVKMVYPLLIMLLGTIIALGFFVMLVVFFPTSFRLLSGYESKKEFTSHLSTLTKKGWVIPASIILGLSINNRSLSLTAALFVMFYLWNKNRKIFLPTTFLYLTIALITLYLTWPGLWGNPLTGLGESLVSNTSFSWGGRTLFIGNLYKPQELPFFYLPYLMAVQFTLPVLILFFLGLFKLSFNKTRNVDDNSLLVIFSAWYLLPFISSILLKPAIYHNFRHFLFITPPLFFVAGLGIELILDNIQNKAILILFVFLILFPGVKGIINLHPYQYIYYNQLVGGLNNVHNKFETDYWGSSYREVTLYLNQIAPQNATVLVKGPDHIVQDYGRRDLNIIRYRKPDAPRMTKEADYAIEYKKGNRTIPLIDNHPIIFSVTRNGAILSELRELDHNR